MPQLGDLFAKLAMGQSLSAAEIEQLRLGMNKQQGITSQMAALLTPGGDLDPNIFSHHSGEFSMLPHASASMLAETDQSIPDETWTALVFDTDATLSADGARLSWESGIKRNVATGEFLLTGVPEQTIWMFSCMVAWASDPTNAYVSVLEKDTATGWTTSYDKESSMNLMQTGAFMMRARKASSSWQLQVYQDSAGALNVIDALFQVTRLR